jgi:PPOX class probable F420-dependent enzyme
VSGADRSRRGATTWQTRGVTDLADFERIANADSGLVVAVSTRADATPQVSVVNAGVLDHPTSGGLVVGLVARGGTRKLANWRRRPRATLVAKTGWEWVAVEGSLEIIGPDDPSPDVDTEGLRLLLRAIFAAAGGTHDDWDEYDRVMVGDRRTAVFVSPERVYSNG